MTFRDSEKARYARGKGEWFSPAAQANGTYRGRPRPFCLAGGCAAENLHPSIGDAAIEYFRARGIRWHDGTAGGTQPSSHLCCSQSCCVNFLFPLASDPHVLTGVLRHVYPDVAEALPIDSPQEPQLPDGGQSYVAFEWLGEADYLSEWRRKRGGPTRGANNTSADFVLRFRRTDGRVQLVLGEWKYTEYYGNSALASEAVAGRSAAVRLETYRESFWRSGGVFADQSETLYQSLFFEPLYQLMRLQLLAQEMERAGEMGASVVSVLHISPEANRELRTFVPGPLRESHPGPGLFETWQALVPTDRFLSLSTERLHAALSAEARPTHPDWVAYLERRYDWHLAPAT